MIEKVEKQIEELKKSQYDEEVYSNRKKMEEIDKKIELLEEELLSLEEEYLLR